MKHLKSIYENSEFDEFGISEDELYRMFYDLEDMGFIFRLNPAKRLTRTPDETQSSTLGMLRKWNLKLEKTIELIIRSQKRSSSSTIQMQIFEDLYESQDFKEMIDVANSRLKVYGLEVSDKKDIREDYLKIYINKINI